MHGEIKEDLGRKTKEEGERGLWQSWTLPFYLTGDVCGSYQVTLNSEFILESSEDSKICRFN